MSEVSHEEQLQKWSRCKIVFIAKSFDGVLLVSFKRLLPPVFIHFVVLKLLILKACLEVERILYVGRRIFPEATLELAGLFVRSLGRSVPCRCLRANVQHYFEFLFLEPRLPCLVESAEPADEELLVEIGGGRIDHKKHKQVPFEVVGNGEEAEGGLAPGVHVEKEVGLVGEHDQG